MLFGRLACNNMSIYYISHTFNRKYSLESVSCQVIIIFIDFSLALFNGILQLFVPSLFLTFLSVYSLKIYNIHNEYVDFVPNLRRLFKYKVQKYG